MIKRIIPLMLSLILLFTSAYAADVSSPGTGSSQAKVTQTASVISVSVPTGLPVTVTSDGTVTTSTDAKIVNNSYGPIKVSSIQLNGANSWSLTNYTTNFKAMKVGLKQFGFQLQGVNVPNTGLASLTGFNSISGGSELPINYEAKVAVQSQAITQDIGNIVITISWDKVPTAYGVVPANVTDYYTFTDDTATSGGWKLGLNADFKAALQANSGDGAAYKDWTTGTQLPNPGSIYQGTPVTSIAYMFDGCSTIKSLDLSLFDISYTKLATNMFRNCTSLSSLNTENFDTYCLTNFIGMFSNCSSLTSINVSNFNMSNATIIGGMFSGCSGLTYIDVSNFDTSNVTSLSGMFNGCTNLISLDLHNFDTSKVINMMNVFRNCPNLVTVDVSSFTATSFDPMGVKGAQNIFDGCTSLTSIDLSSFDASKLSDSLRSYMFQNCTSVTIAYARTQADADLLNASPYKAANVNFVVK